MSTFIPLSTVQNMSHFIHFHSRKLVEEKKVTLRRPKWCDLITGGTTGTTHIFVDRLPTGLFCTYSPDLRHKAEVENLKQEKRGERKPFVPFSSLLAFEEK